PNLSGEYQGRHLDADADLILDDLLLELKVSVHPKPHLKVVLQLLGYAVLAAHRGVGPITRIGCYNPRFGLLWAERIDFVLRWLGWGCFEEFRAAFDQAVGVELRTVQRIEGGKTNLVVGTLVELAHVLGVKPAALLKEAEVPEVKNGRPRRGVP